MSDIPKLVVLMGLPGSGKTTFAKDVCIDFFGYKVYVSSDDIRAELGFTDEIMDRTKRAEQNQRVFNLAHQRIRQALENGQSVVFDATNITRKSRKALLNSLHGVLCHKTCGMIWTPTDQCIENCSERERKVSESVIYRMRSQWETPVEGEGWDELAIFPHLPNNDYVFQDFCKQWYLQYKYYDQRNPHHELTLGQHARLTKACLEPITIRQMITCSNELNLAAFLHDIGKPYTQSLEHCQDGTTIAHYYNHANVGAYESILYIYSAIHNHLIRTPSVSEIHTMQLINYHMLPFQWEKDANVEKKHKKLFGDKLFNELKLLHLADIKS